MMKDVVDHGHEHGSIIVVEVVAVDSNVCVWLNKVCLVADDL